MCYKRRIFDNRQDFFGLHTSKITSLWLSFVYISSVSMIQFICAGQSVNINSSQNDMEISCLEQRSTGAPYSITFCLVTLCIFLPFCGRTFGRDLLGLLQCNLTSVEIWKYTLILGNLSRNSFICMICFQHISYYAGSQMKFRNLQRNQKRSD